MTKYLLTSVREYIFIFLTATIFLSAFTLKSYSEENVFHIDNVVVNGPINLNFSRDKYINKAFVDSFEILMSKILLSRDLGKIKNIKLKQKINLVKSFRIIDEKYKNDQYEGAFEVFYNEKEIKNFLRKKNISFSQPKNISAVYFPVLFIDEEIQNFNENFFYNNWQLIKIKNELINFILPIEDLDDISEIKLMKNKTEEINIDNLINKYNTKNFVFTLMNYQNNNLNIYIKTNFNNNKVSRNISFELKNIKDEKKLNSILEQIKTQVTDIWKEENIINLAIPLTIDVIFKYKNLKDLDSLEKDLSKINLIENHSLEDVNINRSTFKIYYFGNPKKLTMELAKFGYLLKNDQLHWSIYKNE